MAAHIKRLVSVYDRRSGNLPPINFDLTLFKNYAEFLKRVCESFHISKTDKQIICNTGRDIIKNNGDFDDIEDGETLYIMLDVKQRLSSSTKKKVVFIPHYDTLIKSGMYEYYASEGQNPLPYAFAELIDNALTATSNNKGLRKIEIRLMFDDDCDNTTIFVMDNGHGMTARQLNNWAIYRLSKFTRIDQSKNTSLSASDFCPKSPNTVQTFPRSLNSDISYFGVGGKQAIFFIGDSTRMMTKPKDSCDVHEMSISKQQFEEKERKGEHIYDGFIVNREPGNTSHLSAHTDDYVHSVIGEENSKDSFTCVAIQGISEENCNFLMLNFSIWCRQLAHIYHYYIHGPDGNVIRNDIDNLKSESKIPSSLGELSIKVKMFNRDVLAKSIDLASVDDDMQTLYVRTSVNTFDFKAVVEGRGIIEGALRYHPFLYDKETYPNGELENTVIPDDQDEEEFQNGADKSVQNRRPIFECFWNGRLIPYTLIEDFEWCSAQKKNKNIPTDCYNRISGVLWTDSAFQVSTNKLTFMDLEVKIRDKSTVFYRVINGQEKRGNIDKQFNEWLLECHEKYDKQIHFRNFQELIHRPELPKTKQYPWSTFKNIKWDDKIFKNGQLVKLNLSTTVHYGSIKRFLLYGEHCDRNVYSTGGFVEVVHEPKSLYGELKVYPIGKLDRLTSEKDVQQLIVEEEGRLPDQLIISWPDGDGVEPDCQISAGTTIGALKVEIRNCKGECISKLPGTNQKKLYMDLKIIHHSSTGDVVVVHHIGQHAKTWPYWFKKMENFNKLGSYSLKLQVVLSESCSTSYANRQLPSYIMKFSVTEAQAKRFTIGVMDGPLLVGVPFKIPLSFEDKYGNCAKPNTKYKPTLSASGLKISYGDVAIKGSTLQVKDIVAIGVVDTNSGKNFTLSVKIPALNGIAQTVKIRLFPGHPRQLCVTPSDDPIEVENGERLHLIVQLRDAAGNNTILDKLGVTCKFVGSLKKIPEYAGYCDSSGQTVLTGPPIKVSGISGPVTITAMIEAQCCKEIPIVERRVMVNPSTKATKIKIFYKNGTGEQVEIESNKDFGFIANSTINKLEFQLCDEIGRKIDLTRQLASKIKVNWVPKTNIELLLKGRLPDIKVPCSVRETKYCSVTINSIVGTAELSFNVRPHGGAPAVIKCSFSSKCDRIRLGEILASDILVTPLDVHGNCIRNLTTSDLKTFSVSADCLCKDKVEVVIGQGNVFLVRGVSFNGGQLGAREICVKWNDLIGYSRLMVLAGIPSVIRLPRFECNELINVVNGAELFAPLVIEMQDSFGNAAEDNNVKVQLLCDPNLKFLPMPQVLKTNKAGIADFHALTVSVLPKVSPKPCTEAICTRPCYGVLCVTPRASYGREQILGPTIQFHVTSDISKPVKIKVVYNELVKCVVNQELPLFTVSVLAEDGLTLSYENDVGIYMRMWRGDSKQQKADVGNNFNLRVTSDSLGLFHFRNVQAPCVAGVYTIQFISESDKHALSSSHIKLRILPSRPIKLVSDKHLTTPTVLNMSKPVNRMIIKSLKLYLQDEFGNTIVEEYNGKVKVSFSSNDDFELPLFICGQKEMGFTLTNGHTTLQNIFIDEKSPGVDGKEYLLRCKVMLSKPHSKISIPEYTIPFLFYDDSEKKNRMAALSKERDELKISLTELWSFFDAKEVLANQLKESVQNTIKEQKNLREQLLKHDINPSILNSMDDVTTCVEERSREREAMKNAPRRRCNLQPPPKEPNILGKVAYLAEVEDDDVARVISWHMSGDMDCLITHNMEKAKEVYERTRGAQQVLSLDAVYRRNLSDWNKPLPHLRGRGNYQPTGNPEYARHFLTFAAEVENCQIVFLSLLGDAVILDTLEDATNYRREVVKHTFCPNLLTRTGDRVLSNGKFGGRQNKAPSIDNLRGAIFGQPFLSKYSNISTIIDLLRSYQSLQLRHKDASTKLFDIKQKKQDNKEMQFKLKELKQLEKRLDDVNILLGTKTSHENEISSSRLRRGVKVAQSSMDLEKIDPSKQQTNKVMPRPRRSNRDSGSPSSKLTNGDITTHEHLISPVSPRVRRKRVTSDLAIVYNSPANVVKRLRR